MRSIIKALLLAALCLAASPSWGAIAVGVHDKKADIGGATTLTSNAINTQTSGSTFWVGVFTDGTFATNPVSDNAGNAAASYVIIGSEISLTANGIKHRRYQCVNCTGKTAHTFTVTTTGNSFHAIFPIEITGAATTTPLDKQDAVEDTGTPFNSPSVTTTQNNELMIGLCQDNSTGDNDTFTAANSFTKLDEITTGNTTITAMSATRNVTSTLSTSMQCTSVQGTSMTVSIDTFIDATQAASGHRVGKRGVF